MTKTIPYIGNGAYCWCNAMSMLLASVGEKISPSDIEVLGGVGLGAQFIKNNHLLFFNLEEPDTGIDNALKILGLKCKAIKISKIKTPPLTELKRDLKQSYVVVGPIDMGYLTYNPRYRYLLGADHFILLYAINNQEIQLHDPYGFPYVSLPINNLIKAWQTDVGYCQKYYRYWTRPKRINNPNQKQIYQKTIKLFQLIYKKYPPELQRKGNLVGKQAILTCLERIKTKKISQTEVEHLTYFALPLGARRALDFSFFFDFKNKDLADLKRQQAVLFGQCQTFTVTKKWKALINSLQQLAEKEEQFQTTLLKK